MKSGIDINRPDSMTPPPPRQRIQRYEGKKTFPVTKEPKVVLSPRQKYILKCVDSQIKLTIFGAYVTPPSEKNYTSEGVRMNKKYKPALKINTKAYTRDTFGKAYNFPISFEDSIHKTPSTSELRIDYNTYEKKVLELLESGCQILSPSKAMDVMSKESREQADWDHLKVKLVFGITTYRPTPLGTENCKTDTTTLKPAYFTRYSSHPNQLKMHRNRKGDPKPDPMATPNINDRYVPIKGPNYYINKSLKTTQQKRDGTIFGSYVHPPCKQTHLNRGQWFTEVLINYHCFRVSHFTTTHFLTEKAVNTYINLHRGPDHCDTRRHFELYTSAVRRLNRQGFDPTGNPMFLHNIGWHYLPHFGSENFYEEGGEPDLQQTVILSP